MVFTSGIVDEELAVASSLLSTALSRAWNLEHRAKAARPDTLLGPEGSPTRRATRDVERAVAMNLSVPFGLKLRKRPGRLVGEDLETMNSGREHLYKLFEQ